jgi:hypothetical protein
MEDYSVNILKYQKISVKVVKANILPKKEIKSNLMMIKLLEILF